MAVRVVVSEAASERIVAAERWLAGFERDRELLILATTLDAATTIVASVTRERGATFGWARATLPRLASQIGSPVLASRGLVAAGHLMLEALTAHVVHRLASEEKLGRFQAISHLPGLVRAVSRAVSELRLAGISADALADADRDLAPLLSAYEHALVEQKLADRALLYRTAAEVVRSGGAAPIGSPTLLLDVAVDTAVEADLVAELAHRAPDLLAVVPAGDARTVDHLRRASNGSLEITNAKPTGAGTLPRLQSQLFDPQSTEHTPADEGVLVLSAPGESREAVEIARRIHRAAAEGVPFDRMAVLLRAPATHRPHIFEAFRRAGIPAHFAQGITRPDPAGRAFLALLACAAEGLSARRFAEYLSLGQVPNQGGTKEPAPPSWVPSDDDVLPPAIAPNDPPKPSVDDDSALPAPRRWERLLVEASVIGGRARWERRLEGLRQKLEKDLERVEDSDPEGAQARGLQRSLADLESLRSFAMPLLDALVNLPEKATWAVWLAELDALALGALRRPERVRAVLAELRPMGPIGPVELAEVRLVLAPRLRDLLVAPESSREGRVLVAPVDFARGLSFDRVFVPGLAEKVFPQKVVEDPVLRDSARLELRELGRLDTNEDRVAAERLALRLAVGAAKERVILSWPRVDVDQARPRVPSFYGLEVLRAAEGSLSGYDELTRRAERATADGAAAMRLGWPAPGKPSDAIDEAEHDLALLSTLVRQSGAKGTARYLLDANPHLARALRARARRWIRKWTPSDGLVDPGPLAKAALARHAFAERSYSPTSLQHYAACPYRFLLQAVHRLAPREVSESVEELDPLQRGSLVHEVLYELLVALREEGRLPLKPADFEPARDLLDRIVDHVAERWRDEVAPAIERVWEDGIASIRADVREWLVRAVNDPSWEPWKFELSFGLPKRAAQDPASIPEPAVVAGGLRLRGSIDLVERNAESHLRATDYKTGKVRAKKDAVVGGGETLQPVLYALALEQMFKPTKVDGGRLYYCTSAGDYEEVVIPLDDYARTAASEVVGIVGEAIQTGFLPAAPEDGACTYCDYQIVCGPHEEQRIKLKAKDRLGRLRTLRSMP
ncbi:MAG: PD-(D/E)XK nuclease family protein [Polyangiales bacterium]